MSASSASVLQRVVDAHRAAAARDGRDLDELLAGAAACPAPRPFAAGLSGPGVAVIAEIKRRSPSRGDLAPGLDAAGVAAAYERGGAACVSVLTDVEFFGGSADDLRAAREATALPVLRKDFTVDARDVADARAMGADAVLLIVAALSDAELSEFLQLARTLGMAALVEVHDDDEARRALALGADIIGVNQRDLRTFEVDTARAERLARLLPDGVVRVAESGIRDRADVDRLRDAGYHAVLVGESLVTADDVTAAVHALAR